MLRFISTVLISVATFFTLNAIIPSENELTVYDTCVRLHVIANSNEEYDQELKLKVRDALLDKMRSYKIDSRDKALETVKDRRNELINTASEVILENGYDYRVELEIGEESYPTRHYDDFSLPAGKYTSVRVKIGEADGENWWCVLYPPLCNTGAIAYEDGSYTDVGLTKEQYSLITGGTGKYKVKFKLIEVAAEIAGFEY